MSDIEEQAIRNSLVSRVGMTIHGDRWIAPLAADLSAVSGRAISGSQIAHWRRGIRPVPDWVEDALLAVVAARGKAIVGEGKSLRLLSGILERRLAAKVVTSPEPDLEPDNAPSMGM